jgi:8-oxo-dGTP pyrophosphatase MutT (NUDIX family)
MRGLPEWWEPLATRALAARRSDFTRFPTPPAGGRRSAVLILLGEQDGSGPDVLVLRRAATMRSHAGQPAFPGGGSDPEDADAVATALREAGEEVGLDPVTTTVVATLPRLWIPVSGFVVTPVLAWWHDPHPVSPLSVEEVDEVHRVPIGELADPANRIRVRHPSGFTGPAFKVRGMLVWGFTAGVLNTLLDLGGWTRPWDETRVEELRVV